MNVFLEVNTKNNKNGNQSVWGGDVDGELQMITLQSDLVTGLVVQLRFDTNFLGSKVKSVVD